MIRDISVHILPRLLVCDMNNDAHIRSQIRLNCQRPETNRPTADSPSPVQPSFNNATEDYTKEGNYV
jgi:hypothetical protein